MVGSGRLITGASIVLFVLVTNLLVTFNNTSAASSAYPTGCTAGQNNTQCEAAGKTSFFAAVLGTTFQGFGDDAPEILNVAWGVIMGFLLTVAVLLIVLAFVPFTNQ